MTGAHPPIRFGLIVSALTLFAVVYVATAQPFSLSFKQGETRWQVVLDGVMGGRSSGEIDTTDHGVVFHGDLSLENNGGFSQIRTEIEQGSLGQAEGIEIDVRGDGRTYIFDARVANMRVMAGSFQHTFETMHDEWTTIRLPFSDFRFHYFGRQMPGIGEINQAMINSLGITLADKQPGEFRLEIGAVRGYSDDQSQRQARIDALTAQLGLNDSERAIAVPQLRSERADRLRKLTDALGAQPARGDDQQQMTTQASSSFASHVMSVCELAIERGVPLFNHSQPEACAAVYEVALSSILALGRDALGGDTRSMIHRAVRDGQRMHDAGERAWHYRRAIDALMRSLNAHA